MFYLKLISKLAELGWVHCDYTLGKITFANANDHTVESFKTWEEVEDFYNKIKDQKEKDNKKDNL